MNMKLDFKRLFKPVASTVLSAALVIVSLSSGSTANTLYCRAAATLADFSFDISDGVSTAKDLNDTDKTTADSGYKPTGGTNSSSSLLFASVAGTQTGSYKKLEWSKASDYSYNNSRLPQTPIIAASEKNPWGTTPFFLVKTSTKGYEDLKITFRIGASKKGPKNYKLELSTDGKSYSTVSASAFSLDTNKVLYSKSIALPKNACNQSVIYIKIVAASTATVEGGDFTAAKASGEIAINNISVTGNAVAAPTATPKATTAPSATTKPLKPSDNTSNATTNNSENNNSTTTVQKQKTIKSLKLTSYKKNSKLIKGKTIKKGM